MAPLRAALRLLAGTLATLVLLVPFLVLRTMIPRRSVLAVSARGCRLWARTLCAVFSIRRRVRGPLPEAARLVVANHLSTLDVLVLGSLYPGVFVSKGEVAHWPLLGPLARVGGTIFLERASPRGVRLTADRMEAALRAGVTVTIFPEGTTGFGDAVGRFQPSLLEPAARLGVPCLPVTLGYDTDAVCWGDDVSLARHGWRILRLRSIEARVTLSAPAVSGSDRKDLAARLRAEIARAFVPVPSVPRRLPDVRPEQIPGEASLVGALGRGVEVPVREVDDRGVVATDVAAAVRDPRRDEHEG